MTQGCQDHGHKHNRTQGHRDDATTTQGHDDKRHERHEHTTAQRPGHQNAGMQGHQHTQAHDDTQSHKDTQDTWDTPAHKDTATRGHKNTTQGHTTHTTWDKLHRKHWKHTHADLYTHSRAQLLTALQAKTETVWVLLSDRVCGVVSFLPGGWSVAFDFMAIIWAIRPPRRHWMSSEECTDLGISNRSCASPIISSLGVSHSPLLPLHLSRFSSPSCHASQNLSLSLASPSQCSLFTLTFVAPLSLHPSMLPRLLHLPSSSFPDSLISKLF